MGARIGLFLTSIRDFLLVLALIGAVAFGAYMLGYDVAYGQWEEFYNAEGLIEDGCPLFIVSNKGGGYDER